MATPLWPRPYGHTLMATPLVPTPITTPLAPPCTLKTYPTPLPHYAPYKKFEIRNKISSQTMSRHALNTYKYIGQVYYGCEIVNIALTLLVEILAYLQTYKIFHSSN